MNWHDIQEMVFDLILDDGNVNYPNRMWLMNNAYDSIGVACSCDPAWGEMCIVELGADVKLLKPLELNHDREEWVSDVSVYDPESNI